MRHQLFALTAWLFSAAACSPNLQPLTISFRGAVGSSDFACGQSYPGLGTAATQVQPADFRLYVHDVRLVDSTGAELPLTLDPDPLWQYQNVALLDFENKVAPCAGTAATNLVVHGQAAAGSGGYHGLRFRLGVPAELNHGNQATAPAPLNFSGLFWTWQDGYKFLRTEGQSAGGTSTFMMHLGSTGCQRDPSGQTQCANLNTPQIDLTAFDPQTNRVAVDLAALLAGSDLSTDAMCQSEPASSVCSPLFQRLGVPFGHAAAGTQTFFRVE